MTLCKVSVKSRLGLTSLVEIAGGAFLMGSDDHYPEEGPTHVVEVAPFLIEETPVTNGQFRAFVRDTGYRTVAERPLEEANFPELSDEERSPGALVFFPTQGPVDLREFGRWWKWTPGAGAPFGGVKQSGNGREGGKWGLEEFLEVKLVSGWK